MNSYILLENGNKYRLISAYGGQENISGEIRDVISLKIETTYDVVKENFNNDMKYSIEQERLVENSDGNETIIDSFDKSDWCLLCSIMDNIDGTITVKMGKKTNYELLEEENAELLYELIMRA